MRAPSTWYLCVGLWAILVEIGEEECSEVPGLTTIAGIWKILPGGRNPHQPRLREKLCSFSKTHGISYTFIHSPSIIHQQHQLQLTHEILFGIQ